MAAAANMNITPVQIRTGATAACAPAKTAAPRSSQSRPPSTTSAARQLLQARHEHAGLSVGGSHTVTAKGGRRGHGWRMRLEVQAGAAVRGARDWRMRLEVQAGAAVRGARDWRKRLDVQTGAAR